MSKGEVDTATMEGSLDEVGRDVVLDFKDWLGREEKREP